MKSILIIFFVVSIQLVGFSQCKVKTSELKVFINLENQSFIEFLNGKKILKNCSEIEKRPFIVSGVEYETKRGVTYKVFFEEGWGVTAPNQHKRDCSNYEGFSTAKIIRIEIIKNWNLIEVIE